METSIQYKGRNIWKKYYASDEGNKEQEFFKKMDEKYKEIDILHSKIEALKEELYEKQQEMKEMAKEINLGYGDEEHLSEDCFFEGWGEIYVNDEKLKMKTAEKRDFWDGTDRQGYETWDDKTKAEYEEQKDWFITWEYADEGWFEMKVEGEFEKSKLKWDGQALSYDDQWGFDDIGSRPSENHYVLYFPKLHHSLNSSEIW